MAVLVSDSGAVACSRLIDHVQYIHINVETRAVLGPQGTLTGKPTAAKRTHSEHKEPLQMMRPQGILTRWGGGGYGVASRVLNQNIKDSVNGETPEDTDIGGP